MGREIFFVVPGEAKTARERTSRARLAPDGVSVIQGHRYDKKDRREWKADVRAAAFAAMGTAGLLEGPLVLTVTFIRPKAPSWPKNACKGNWWPWALWKMPDLPDNLKKPVMDAMKGVVWKDDAQVVRDEGWKVQGERHLTLVQVRQASFDELDEQRAKAEGVICDLLSGALCSDQGEQDAWVEALVGAGETASQ